MKILAYEKKYKSAVQSVCIETSFAKDNPKKREFVLAMYCDGYLEQGLAYVLLDDFEEVQGYILCAPDYSRYKKQLHQSMENMNLFEKVWALGEAMGYKVLAKEYPAHLHIDIRDSFTGKGSGSMLMATLLEELTNRGIAGVMLQVGKKNTRAFHFYKKNGFELLKDRKIVLAMGRKLWKTKE